MDIKLTQYSHGAGCGCKISPKVLDEILKSDQIKQHFPNLLVGNEERDDAAVLNIGNGMAIVSTTDFFMPITDDAEDFGRIAAVNAISDVYAMGGEPILAIAILGFPINLLPAEIANKIIEGGRKACAEAGIPLAGGHSIDCPEPIFGLAVTGKVKIKNLKKNGGASVGDVLFLTKPLGVGIFTTAQKKGKIRNNDLDLAKKSMMTLNKIGALLGTKSYVKAMTDVTGFGLLGHLSEMCEASHNVSACVDFEKVPLLNKPLLDEYIVGKCIPGGTVRNWDSYGHKIAQISDYQRDILCDPQTSGGLLVAVSPKSVTAFQRAVRKEGFDLSPIGRFIGRGEQLIMVE